VIYRPIFRRPLWGWLLLTPTLIILLLFLYYPVLQSLILSFYRSNLFLGTRKFIGLENYISLFSGPQAPAFIQASVQTLLYAVLVTFPGLLISMILAVLASQPIKGARIYRLFLIWPFALSPAVAGTLFLFLFNPEVGVVNQVIFHLFHFKPRWLDNPVWATILVYTASIWKNMGYNIVFYLAALQNMPSQVLEAADIDGVSTIKKFIHIIIPMLGSTTFFLIFTNLANCLFTTFGLIDILTSGGPMGPGFLDNTGVTTLMIVKIFQDGFGGSSNMGLAASEGILLMMLAIGLTTMQFRMSKDKVYYAGT